MPRDSTSCSSGSPSCSSRRCVVWWVGVVAGMVAPRWRMVVHGASIGAFVGLAAVQVLSGVVRPLALGLSAAAALAAWVLTVRSAAFRLWSEFLAVLPVFALLVFLFASPSSDVVSGADFAAAASSGTAAPVVLIVLDELPTASIIDANGAIDAVRFPNLARLAGEATWYRNHTTQSGFTNTAVPTIFTGNNPTARRAAVHAATRQHLPPAGGLARPRGVRGPHPAVPHLGLRGDAPGASSAARTPMPRRTSGGRSPDGRSVRRRPRSLGGPRFRHRRAGEPRRLRGGGGQRLVGRLVVRVRRGPVGGGHVAGGRREPSHPA